MIFFEYFIEVSCDSVVTCKLFHVCVSFLDYMEWIRYYVCIHSVEVVFGSLPVALVGE